MIAILFQIIVCHQTYIRQKSALPNPVIKLFLLRNQKHVRMAKGFIHFGDYGQYDTVLFWLASRAQSVLFFLTVVCDIYTYSYWKQGKVPILLYKDKSGHDLATSFVFILNLCYSSPHFYVPGTWPSFRFTSSSQARYSVFLVHTTL